MEKILLKIKETRAANEPSVEALHPIVGLLKGALQKVCYWCGGVGHFDNKCVTKKQLNRAFYDMGYRIQWGTIKSTVVSAKIAKYRKRKVDRETEETRISLGKRVKI